MKWWWPFPRPETKVSASGPAISYAHVGRPVWTPRQYEKQADEAYVRNAVAFRCAKLIATSAASAPWLLKDKRGGVIEEHPLLNLLKRPAPMIGGASLFEAVYAYLLLAGNSYLEAVAPQETAPPRELWALRPDRMKVIAGEHGLPRGYEYDVNGRTVRWDADPVTGAGPVLHFKEFHPLNDWYGLSRVDPAAYAVDRHNAASAHNKALLDNGARPSGALVFEPVKLSDGSVQAAPPEVIQKAEKELKEKHGGPANSGRAFVFGGNVRWEEMGITPKDMDFGAGKEDAARDICLSFGVPHILIVPGQATYNNVREAKLELWEDTILPLIDKVVDQLDAQLAPRFGEGLSLGVDLDEISALEPRRESKRKSVVELLDKGVIDEDEAREALQYGPRKAEAVKKIDAAVLTALIKGADQEGGIVPLYRYLRSVGLLDPADTVDAFSTAWASGAITDEDLIAATTPPENEPAPSEEDEDADP